MRKLFSTGFLRSASLAILPFLLISCPPSVSTQKAETKICQTKECLPAGNSHTRLNFLLTKFSTYTSTRKRICQTKECITAANNLKASINDDVKPCDDFYEYACGNWVKAHQNSISDESQGAFDLRYDENMAEILEFLKQNNSNDEPEAVHKARKFFSLCSNNASFSNTLKIKPIETILREIGLKFPLQLSGGNENFDYITALAKASRLTGTDVFFKLEVEPHPFNQTFNMIGINKPSIGDDSDIALVGYARSRKSKRRAKKITEPDNANNKTEKICKEDNSTVCNQLHSLLNSTTDFKLEEVLNYVKQIDAVIEKPSSYFSAVYSLNELQDISDEIAVKVNTTIPKLNWTRYVEETFRGLDNVTLDLSDLPKIEITIEDFDFFKDMIRFIHESQNTKQIELGIWWKTVKNLLSYIDSGIFDIDESSNSKTREQQCGELTATYFDMAVSYVYTTKEKYIRAKPKIRTMFEHIRGSFQQLIKAANWMDELTRRSALRKLQYMRANIVYPSIIKTTPILNDFYKDVRISDNFYDIIISLLQNQVTKSLNTLNQRNDREKDDGSAAPIEVNAFYIPDKNTLIIPAGIVGTSFYYPNSLYAFNYGAIGSIIGHEMTHGFDNNGRNYNEVGAEELWWESITENMYRKKAKCFADAYVEYRKNSSNMTENSTRLIDKTQTLGEDISDNTGFSETLMAYKKCTNLTGEEPLLPQFENFTHEQLLTLAFANVWCENSTDSDFSDWQDVHSPGGIRVNGVLRNSPEFAQIWKCPINSPMNPSDKCEIW